MDEEDEVEEEVEGRREPLRFLSTRYFFPAHVHHSLCRGWRPVFFSLLEHLASPGPPPLPRFFFFPAVDPDNPTPP